MPYVLPDQAVHASFKARKGVGRGQLECTFDGAECGIVMKRGLPGQVLVDTTTSPDLKAEGVRAGCELLELWGNNCSSGKGQGGLSKAQDRNDFTPEAIHQYLQTAELPITIVFGGVTFPEFDWGSMPVISDSEKVQKPRKSLKPKKPRKSLKPKKVKVQKRKKSVKISKPAPPVEEERLEVSGSSTEFSEPEPEAEPTPTCSDPEYRDLAREELHKMRNKGFNQSYNLWKSEQKEQDDSWLLWALAAAGAAFYLLTSSDDDCKECRYRRDYYDSSW